MSRLPTGNPRLVFLRDMEDVAVTNPSLKTSVCLYLLTFPWPSHVAKFRVRVEEHSRVACKGQSYERIGELGPFVSPQHQASQNMSSTE